MVKEAMGIANHECPLGDRCPHLNFQAAAKVLAERNYLRERIKKMEELMALAEAKILSLQEENNHLKEAQENLLQELNEACRRPFKPNKRAAEQGAPAKNKRGAPCGHRGATRKKPTQVDEYIDIYPTCCPTCGSKEVTGYETFKDHLVEDLEIKVKTSCFRHHYGYCPRCKKTVYISRDTNELSKSNIGPVARAVGGYLHYLGIPFRKTQQIFENIFGLEITHPSLVGFDNKMGEQGEPLYEQIKSLVRHSSIVYSDETCLRACLSCGRRQATHRQTGWRVSGINHWLWGFTNQDVALSRIEQSRGSKVVEEVLGKKYAGYVVSDFYSAYNRIKAKGKQKCLGHLLKEVKGIMEKNNYPEGSLEWSFCQRLKAILKMGIEVWDKFRRGEKTFEDLNQTKEIMAQVLTELIQYPSEDSNIKRLQKRLIKHHNELLTFLDHPEVEPTNNRAERQLRPNVIMRKITFGNRSFLGARNHQVVMSIIHTARLNGIEPFNAFLSLTTNQQNELFAVQKIRAP